MPQARLVEPDDLELDGPALIVQVVEPASYRAAHVPGAVLVEPRELVSGIPPATGRLPDLERLTALFSRIGYRPGLDIVACDDEGGRLGRTLSVDPRCNRPSQLGLPERRYSRLDRRRPARRDRSGQDTGGDRGEPRNRHRAHRRGRRCAEGDRRPGPSHPGCAFSRGIQRPATVGQARGAHSGRRQPRLAGLQESDRQPAPGARPGGPAWPPRHRAGEVCHHPIARRTIAPGSPTWSAGCWDIRMSARITAPGRSGATGTTCPSRSTISRQTSPTHFVACASKRQLCDCRPNPSHRHRQAQALSRAVRRTGHSRRPPPGLPGAVA